MSEGALRGPLEAILMVAAEPVAAEEVAAALGVDAGEVERELNALARVGRFVVGSAHARLSQAALETLAVIAYRQPISRSRICKIRGVNVDGVVRTLLARGLVEETGTTPSGAHLYGTTTEFLEKMGMSSLSELLPLAPYLPEADALIELEEEL